MEVKNESFKTGSRKRQFKSPREGDNDEDNHETIDMIRQQLYGPGGPYENKAHKIRHRIVPDIKSFHSLQRRRYNREDEEETTFGRQPAKKLKHGPSDIEILAISGLIAVITQLMLVNRQPNFSFSTGNGRDNHKTTTMIHQRCYGPGESVNQTESESPSSKTLLAKCKRWQDDCEDEEETTFSQQPAKKHKHVSSYRNRPLKRVQPPIGTQQTEPGLAL